MEYYQLSFQNVSSPNGENLIFFHDNIMFVVITMTFLVAYVMIIILLNKNYYKYIIHGALLEVIWTIMPAIILMFMAMPSLQLLYTLDEITDPTLTLKAIGHQWYWSYEYSDMVEDTIEMNSYMIPMSELKLGDFSLLEVDNNIVLPLHTNISMIVTGADVIHCFAMPSLGMKMDAVPGRLNQVNFTAKSPGIFYGQCSEICGSDHSFMPIVLNISSKEYFVNFMSSNL